MNTGKEAQPGLSKLHRAGYVLVAAMPVLALVDLFPVARLGSLNIRPTDLIFVLAWALCGLDLLFNMRAPKGFARYVVCILGLLATTAIGTLLLNNSVDWPGYLRFNQTMLWGALAIVFIRHEKQFQRLGDAVILCALVLSFSSVYLYIRNPELQRVAGYMTYDREVEGTLNEWGSFYVLALAVLLWRTYCDSWSLRRVTAVVVITAGLLLVQSRSAFLALVVVILVFAVFWIRKMKRDGSKAAAAGSLVFLVALAVGIVVGSDYLPVNRIKDSFVPGSYADVSTGDRYIGWRRSEKMIQDASLPQWVVGYGNMRFTQLSGSPTSESFYLDQGVAEGFAGLSLILTLLLFPAARLRSQGTSDQGFLLGMLITIIALIVSLTGNVLVNPTFGGATFALLYSLVSIQESRKPLTHR